MDSLIDRLVRVEGEAGSIIEKAHAEAGNLEKQAAIDMEQLRKELADAVENRIAAFRAEAARQHESEAATQQALCARDLQALDQVPETLISGQVKKIVARFQEM